MKYKFFSLLILLAAVFWLSPILAKALTFNEIYAGQVLDETESFSYSTGSLINDQGTVYFIYDTTKIPFTSKEAFLGLGYSFDKVISGDLSKYRRATSYFLNTNRMEHPWGSWLLHNGTVYYSFEDGLIGVSNWETFLNNGGDAKHIIKANSYDINVLNSKPKLSLLLANDTRVHRRTSPTNQQPSSSPVDQNQNQQTSQPAQPDNSSQQNQISSPPAVSFTRLSPDTIRSVQYPGPNTSSQCYNHMFLAGCFDSAKFKADMEKVKQAGFNTVWIVTFWKDFQSKAFPTVYNSSAFSNMDAGLTVLDSLGMTAILAPQYGIGGAFPEGYNELIWLFDDSHWKVFEEYVGEFSRKTASHNVIYMFYTEGTEPNRTWASDIEDMIQSGEVTSGQPVHAAKIMPENFRAWISSINPSLSYWNQRWGSSFKDFGEILPNPADNNGYNNRFVDYQRWTASLIKNRFVNLPTLVKQNTPGALVGYHDYSLINLNWVSDGTSEDQMNAAKAFLPIPPNNNKFDFFSFVYYYPFDNADQIKPELQKRYDRFSYYYAKIPKLLGETGVYSYGRTEQQRADLLKPVFDFAAEKKIGINLWNWVDAANSQNTAETTWGLLDKDGNEKGLYAGMTQLIKSLDEPVIYQNPSGFGASVSDQACGQVSLYWFRNGAVSFSLYRSTQNNPDTAQKIVNNQIYTDATYGGYVDSNVSGATYYYWVENTNGTSRIALYNNNKGGLFVPGCNSEIAQDPSGFGGRVVTEICGRIDMWWFRNSAGAYNIYRSTTNNSDLATKIVGNLSYTDLTYGGYSDLNLSSGTYYYWVENVGGTKNRVALYNNSQGGLTVGACE